MHDCKKYCLVIILLFSFCLVGCGSEKVQQSVQTKEPEWQVYTNKDLGISFSYPYEWVEVNSEEIQMNPKPIFFAADPNAVKDFYTNINLLKQESQFLAPSAEDQANATIEYMKNMELSTGMKDCTKIAFTTLDIHSYKAGYLDSEYIISQTGESGMNRQLFVPVGQNTFILTMTTRKAEWGKYEPIFTKIVESFELI